MQIKVWSNFSKRRNSTKQPTGGTTVNVVLKDQCSIISPVFLLNTLDFTINYVEAFGHYYFADVTNLDGNRSEISCTMDYLATFKSNISAYTGFVEYAASSSDVTITDPRNMVTGLLNITPTKFTMTATSAFSSTGCYVVGVSAMTANGATGMLDYYCFSPAQMAIFCAEINDSSIWTQIQNQFAGSTVDAIVSCIWLPFATVGTGSYVPHIGNTAITSINNASRVTNRIVTLSTGLTSIGFSAGSGGAGAAMTYLEKAPFATGELYLPFIGFVELDMDILAFTKSMQINGFVDVVTGDIIYMLKYGAISVSTYSGNLATKVPVSGASYDGIGVASGAITALGGLAAASIAVLSGGSAIPALAAAGAGAMHAASSTKIHTMVNGNTSSALGIQFGKDPIAIIYQNYPSFTTLTAPKTELGMPYFKTTTLSSLSGYIKCRDASVDIPGDGAEQDAVNTYLNSGFYLE